MQSKRKVPKETSKTMEPKTVLEEATAKLIEFLKNSGQARSASITISHLAFAKDLSAELLAQAGEMEKRYKKIKKALEAKASDKACRDFIAEMEASMQVSDGLKSAAAGFLSSTKPKKSKGGRKKKGEQPAGEK